VHRSSGSGGFGKSGCQIQKRNFTAETEKDQRESTSQNRGKKWINNDIQQKRMTQSSSGGEK